MIDSFKKSFSKPGDKLRLNNCGLAPISIPARDAMTKWMNRLFDLPETSGLLAPAPGWT